MCAQWLYVTTVFCCSKQESHAAARKPRDAAADNDKFKSSQASKARLQSSKHIGAKQNLTPNDDSKSFQITR